MRSTLASGRWAGSSGIAAVILVAVGLAAIGGRPAQAEGIHVFYGPRAPERFAHRTVVYYEGVLNLEHNHPREFAREHPFYTRMFNDPAVIERLIARWEAHEQRFEYWHDCLWKVLDGYRTTHPGSSSGTGGRATPGNIGIPSMGGGSPENPPAGTSSGGGPHPFSVPEPSSGLLLTLGLSFCAMGYRFARSGIVVWSGRHSD